MVDTAPGIAKSLRPLSLSPLEETQSIHYSARIIGDQPFSTTTRCPTVAGASTMRTRDEIDVNKEAAAQETVVGGTTAWRSPREDQETDLKNR